MLPKLPVSKREKSEQYTWFGKIALDQDSQVILVVDGESVTGNIRWKENLFQIRPLVGGGHIVRQIDPNSFADEMPPVSPEGDSRTSTDELEAAADSAEFIDILVVYSNAVATASANIQAEIQLAIDETNAAYQNSQIEQQLRLVHAAQVNYNDTGNFSTDLGRLRGTADGFIDNVHGLRNTYGADLVSLWVESGNACGIGYLMTSIQPSFESNGFNVVLRGCATGNYSFGHELGHNMGAHHDTYVAPENGAYSYSHGFVNTAAHWRTIMAYNNACADLGFNCTRIQYFSNPVVSYGGNPTGIAGSADNATTLNNSDLTVANFRQAVTPPPPPTALLEDDFEMNSMSEWDVKKGNWMITGGDMTCSTEKKGEIFALIPWQESGQSACTSCEVTAGVRFDAAETKVSLMGWYQNSKTNVEILLNEMKDKISLKQKSNGIIVVKKSAAATLDTLTDYVLRVNYSSGNFEVFLNDVLS